MTAAVLVVEDNFVLALDVEAEADKLGLAVQVTRDPDEAVAIARRSPLAAALVDVNLNGGYEGLEVVRALATCTDAPIVIMTGYSSADLAGRMDGLRTAAVLFKPIDGDALRDLLRWFGGSGAAPMGWPRATRHSTTA
jgi:DNA-binding response OmpR family regulator